MNKKETIQFYIDGSHNINNQNLLIYGILMSDDDSEHFLIDKKCCHEIRKSFQLRNNVVFGSTDSELWSFYSLLKLIFDNKEKFSNKKVQIYTDSLTVAKLAFGENIPKRNNYKMVEIYNRIIKLLSDLNSIDIECFHVYGHGDSWGNLLIDEKVKEWSRRFNLNRTKDNNKVKLSFDTITSKLKSISL